MKLIRFYTAAAIFILLTAIKLTMPSVSEEITAAIESAMEMEQRQTRELAEMGRELRTLDLKAMLAQEEAPAPAEIGLPELSPPPSPTPPPVPEPTPTPEPEYVKKVEAFKEQQAAFSDYAVPANVSYEVPELPFDYVSPVEGLTSSGFGYRLHPIENEVLYHYGTDFAADTGTPIRAFADGTIVAAGPSDSFGNYVLIYHDEGYSTLYAHCSELCMGCGAVKRGEVIALVGQTGHATGPHLHFELKQNDVYLNPEFYI